MAMDTAPPPYRRPLCAGCHLAPRLPGVDKCRACFDAAIAAQQAWVTAHALADQRYVPPPRPDVRA